MVPILGTGLNLAYIAIRLCSETRILSFSMLAIAILKPKLFVALLLTTAEVQSIVVPVLAQSPNNFVG